MAAELQFPSCGGEQRDGGNGHRTLSVLNAMEPHRRSTSGTRGLQLQALTFGGGSEARPGPHLCQAGRPLPSFTRSPGLGDFQTGTRPFDIALCFSNCEW